MSSRAAIVRIIGGRVEHLRCGNAYDVVNAVIDGPGAVDAYINGDVNWAGREVIGWRTSINSVEDCGCLLVDYDKKIVIFYGGDIECSYAGQRIVMVRIASDPSWKGWDVRWAYKGLLDAARYLGQEEELARDPYFGKVDMTGITLPEDEVTFDPKRAASIVAVRRSGTTRIHPLDTMFPEDLLHYGERALVRMLDKQGYRKHLQFDDYDFVSGFLFDEDTNVVTMWGLCCDLLPESVERALPGWRAVDLEGDRKEFERRVEGAEAGVPLGPHPT